MDPSVLIQKQVRENSEDVKNYLLGLESWEEEIKKQEQRRVYLSSGDGTAISEKRDVTREDVDYVKSVFEDGVRQMKNGKWDQAVSSFSKAIKKYKKNPVFYIKRAKCNMKLQRYLEAETDCTEALALDPKILKAKFYRSKSREMRNNLRGACLDLQDIIILDPGNQTAKAALDHLRPIFQATHRGGSTKLFDDEVPNKEIGVLDVLSGNNNAADEAILEEKIHRANLEKERGNIYVKAEEWEKAKDSYSKAISLYPNDAIFYANRAVCHIKLNNVSRAIVDCGMALKKNPRYSKAYFRRARARRATNDLWGARYDIKQLLLLEPFNTAAKQELEELNVLIEEKVYADYTVHETESSSSDEAGYESAEDLPQQINEETYQEPYELSYQVDEPNQAFRYVFPVPKPPHLRSEKPLKRIPIRFIDDPVASNADLLKPKPKEKLPEWFNNPTPIMDEENIKEDLVRTTLSNSLIQPQRKKAKQENVKKISKENVKKISKENVKKKLEENITENLEEKQTKEIPEKDFKYVHPVFKKPHQRSKKPLRRIRINFIQ